MKSVRGDFFKKIITISLLSLAAMVFITIVNTEKTVTRGVVGTYANGEGGDQVLFSIGENGNDYYFLYIDQANERYIKGNVKMESERYLLYCENEKNNVILPKQEIAFQTYSVTLTICGNIFQFDKINDVPTVIGDIGRYS